MTDSKREIGGYLELERFEGRHYHEKAVRLNCGRGCLGYLVELRGIRSVLVPDLMCGSVPLYFERQGVKVRTYSIDEGFVPDYGSFDMGDGEWLLLMDYYGQLRSGDVEAARVASSERLIVDESQGFFRSPWPMADTVYTCRKWFGVADGGYASTSDGARLERSLPQDESHARMGFVLGRCERSASEFYAESVENNERFDAEPPKTMSAVTENILKAIDYEMVRDRRNANWNMLDNALGPLNGMRLRAPAGAFMYPLYLGACAQDVRCRLIDEGVYVPMLWPGVSKRCLEGSAAIRYSEGILPLPIDQRYGADDMEYLANLVMKFCQTNVRISHSDCARGGANGER